VTNQIHYDATIAFTLLVAKGSIKFLAPTDADLWTSKLKSLWL